MPGETGIRGDSGCGSKEERGSSEEDGGEDEREGEEGRDDEDEEEGSSLEKSSPLGKERRGKEKITVRSSNLAGFEDLLNMRLTDSFPKILLCYCKHYLHSSCSHYIRQA